MKKSVLLILTFFISLSSSSSEIDQVKMLCGYTFNSASITIENDKVISANVLNGWFQTVRYSEEECFKQAHNVFVCEKEDYEDKSIYDLNEQTVDREYSLSNATNSATVSYGYDELTACEIE